MAEKEKLISQAEMARRITVLDEDLEKARLLKVSRRYSMRDMILLTRWSQEYLIRLEQEGRIPKAGRIGSPHGDPGMAKDKRRKTPDRRGRVRQWTEEQAREILGFREEQDRKFGR